ncbi:hypothetical protein DHEL01_v205185 [Diaporthe helianthi]|uniref:Uncharacterized protein n=1 Tax=Diaporthe helianthi TaxID=158607 RepID=A0A2P5I1P6_DIAHE|nr:hypothetical protein DHEL01_v205185 [Diaporthe helianthi]
MAVQRKYWSTTSEFLVMPAQQSRLHLSSGPDDAAVSAGPGPPRAQASSPLPLPPPFSSSASPHAGVEVHERKRCPGFPDLRASPLACAVRSASLPGDARDSERHVPSPRSKLSVPLPTTV